MEENKVDSKNTDQTEFLVVPQNSEPKQKRKFPKLKPPIIIATVGLILLVVGLAAYSSDLKPKAAIEESKRSTELKSYANNYYHYRFKFPANWTLETRPDTYYTGDMFKLSSPDGEIVIENTEYNSSQKQIKEKLYAPAFLLAHTSAEARRLRYLDQNNETNDSVYITARRQKEVWLHLKIKGDFESNNAKVADILKTFTYIQQEPLVGELFSYSLPLGWTLDEGYNDIRGVRFVSPDIIYNKEGNQSPLKGGTIIVSKSRKTINGTLKDIVNGAMTHLENKPYEYPKRTISGYEALSTVRCYEGCSEENYLIKGDEVWVVAFSCYPDCTTKSKFDSSIYAKDRDSFIDSIKFN